MRTKDVVLLVLLIVAISVSLASKYFAHFPGDVAAARWVQSLVPPNLNWAEGFSRTAEFPQILLILALIVALSWALAGCARRAYLHPQPGGDVGPGKLARPGHCPAAAFPGTGARVSTTFGL